MRKMDSESKDYNLRHYFVSRDHESGDYFTFSATFRNKNYIISSCSDVFSKNELDYGSLVLVKTLLDNNIITADKTLDMCCGYGTIGMLVADNVETKVSMCDINTTAVSLAKENVKKNNCNNVVEIFESNMFESVTDEYKHIISNPPIKTGKKLLFVDGAYIHLLDGGDLTVVIKKNLGAASLKTYITEVFDNCEILERDKGYYILYARK